MAGGDMGMRFWLEQAEVDMSVWPPLPGSSFGGDGTFSTFAEANQSILLGVRRIKNGLWLTMQFDGREQGVLLIWDASPSVEDIESMLSGQVGRSRRQARSRS